MMLPGYTGSILSGDKPCAGVKWFRTSKMCVYVYERWPGLTACVCTLNKSYYYFKYVVTTHSDARLLHRDSRPFCTMSS